MGRPPGRKHSTNVALRVDPGLREALEKVAAEEERSLAQVTRMLLREALEAREAKRGGPPESKRKGKPS
jgi:hypothetical protein